MRYWSEQRHDVELQDETGRQLGRARLAEGLLASHSLHGMTSQLNP
ncbi:MAG: hypothetical protein ACRDSR_07605 [Pseudonocardiaceae bacterium]